MYKSLSICVCKNLLFVTIFFRQRRNWQKLRRGSCLHQPLSTIIAITIFYKLLINFIKLLIG